MTLPTTQHDRHALLLEHLSEYLSAKQKSARWLGITVANDPRLIPNLTRGQQYPARIMLNLAQRLVEFYRERLEQEQAPFALAA